MLRLILRLEFGRMVEIASGYVLIGWDYDQFFL